MHERTRSTRPQLIERLRRRIDRDGWPRAQMLLIVVLTGGAGFVASWGMLHLGVQAMALRYALACLLAYLVFLGLLGLWLRTRANDYLEVPNVDVPDFGNLGERSAACVQGHGGESAGGGASASWLDARNEMDLIIDSPGNDDVDVSGALGDSLGAAADADEFAIPLFLVVALIAMLLSSLFVVWTAPVLFAELLVDGVLAASLYRRLRGLDARHWLDSAVRRTFWPFLATTVLAAVVGWILQWQAPGAVTIGEALARMSG